MIGSNELDWADAKSFARVVEVGSIRRAAKEMGVHHSTVSRHVDGLEHSLGTRLFDRHPEGFTLTVAGEEFAKYVVEISTRFNDAERHISGQDRDLSGVVTVTIEETLAINAFAPRLAEFAAAHPEIEVRILVTDNVLDISIGAADIAVRVDNNPPETLVGKRLFAYNQTVYASPKYLAAHDFKNAPEKACWIGSRENDSRYPEWTKETEFSRVPVWGFFPNTASQQAAAGGGLGLVMLPCYLGDRDPLLVRATARKPMKARDIWLLTHSDLRKTARIRAFMSFAEKVLREGSNSMQGITSRD